MSAEVSAGRHNLSEPQRCSPHSPNLVTTLPGLDVNDLAHFRSARHTKAGGGEENVKGCTEKSKTLAAVRGYYETSASPRNARWDGRGSETVKLTRRGGEGARERGKWRTGVEQWLRRHAMLPPGYVIFPRSLESTRAVAPARPPSKYTTPSADFQRQEPRISIRAGASGPQSRDKKYTPRNRCGLRNEEMERAGGPAPRRDPAVTCSPVGMSGVGGRRSSQRAQMWGEGGKPLGRPAISAKKKARRNFSPGLTPH